MGSIICRCLAALVTEIQTARTAERNAAELGSLQSRAQERPDLKEVESLEALWAPRSSDDSRAMLEHLQAQVAASGSSSGLNGALSCLLALTPKKNALCTALPNGTVILWWARVQNQDNLILAHADVKLCWQGLSLQAEGYISFCCIALCSGGPVRWHRLGAGGIFSSVSL